MIYWKKFSMKTPHITKKWSFPLRTASVNVTKSARNCGFGHTCCKNSLYLFCYGYEKSLKRCSKKFRKVHRKFYKAFYKETLAQVFSCEFCEISKETFNTSGGCFYIGTVVGCKYCHCCNITISILLWHLTLCCLIYLECLWLYDCCKDLANFSTDSFEIHYPTYYSNYVI